MEQVLSTIWNLCTTATNDSTTATSDATTNSSSAQAQYAISQGMLPLEQSYIENILRLNKGKQATVVMTYERGSSLGTQSYTGIIEATGRDHIVISEPQSGKRYLLLMIYLDYVEFPEEITYLPSQQATYTQDHKKLANASFCFYNPFTTAVPTRIHATINATPPRGVIGPKNLIPVVLNAYKLPENIIIPATISQPAVVKSDD